MSSGTDLGTIRSVIGILTVTSNETDAAVAFASSAPTSTARKEASQSSAMALHRTEP